MLVAMAIDAVLGWPERLFRLLGHPVTWLGRLINRMDAICNRDSDPPAFRRAAGTVAALGMIALPAVLAWTVQAQLAAGWSRILIVGILAWPLLALRSAHRSLAKPIVAYLRSVEAEDKYHRLVVLIPEVEPARPSEWILHNQRGIILDRAIRRDTSNVVLCRLRYRLATLTRTPQ